MWPKSASKRWLRITCQRDKRLDVLPLGLADIATHGIVTAGITMLVMQPFEDAPTRVPLLGRRLVIIGKNLLDDGMKGAELASHKAHSSRAYGFLASRWVNTSRTLRREW